MFVIHERYGLHKCRKSTLFRDPVDFAITAPPSSSLPLLRVPFCKPLPDVEFQFRHLPRVVRSAVIILPPAYLRVQPLNMLLNGLYPRFWWNQTLLDDIPNMLLGLLAEPLLVVEYTRPCEVSAFVLRWCIPRKSNPSSPVHRPTIRVFVGWSVISSRSMMAWMRLCARSASLFVFEITTKSSAYLVNSPYWRGLAATPPTTPLRPDILLAPCSDRTFVDTLLRTDFAVRRNPSYSDVLAPSEVRLSLTRGTRASVRAVQPKTGREGSQPVCPAAIFSVARPS